jgi:hypothetical protein
VRIFEVSAFNTLHLHWSELEQSNVLPDVMIIADEADRQLTETMRSFMAKVYRLEGSWYENSTPNRRLLFAVQLAVLLRGRSAYLRPANRALIHIATAD